MPAISSNVPTRIVVGVAERAGRVDFAEAEQRCGCRIGRKLQRVVLGIGDMGLVARGLAHAQLGLCENHLSHREVVDDLRQLRGRHARGEPRQKRARDIYVHQIAREHESSARWPKTVS